MGVATGLRTGGRQGLKPAVTEPAAVRFLLIGTALVFLFLFLLLPILILIVSALAKGVGVYFHSIIDPAALAALRLTLLTAAITQSQQWNQIPDRWIRPKRMISRTLNGKDRF